MKSITSPAVFFLAALFTAFCTNNANAAPEVIDPVIEIEELTPTADIFGKGLKKEPAVVKSLKDAEPYLDKASLAKLEKAVDFEKQIVLIFAWKGSGQDKLSVQVAESFPEQISFNHQPGRTRDLRPHFFVFALRNNVTWKVK